MLYIATPCYGGMVTQGYAESMRALQGHVEYKFDATVNESLITRARCLSVARFLKSDSDLFMFIDSDITFPPQAITSMIEADYDICVVPYPKKVIQWENAVNKDNPESASVSLVVNHRNGEIIDGGTGFMMIKRHVFEKMIEHFPELRVRNDHQNAEIPYYHLLFDTMKDGERYLSEDYAFCRRAQQVGFKVMLLQPTPSLGHIGNLQFQGQYNLRT